MLSIGRIEAAGATNVVPDEVSLEGTLRLFDEERRRRTEERIDTLAAANDRSHGTRTEVLIDRGYPCVVNDARLTAAAAELARAQELDVAMLPLRTTAEDFGHYCTRYPALFYRLGVGTAAGRTHTAHFAPDERAIDTGIGFMHGLALKFLES